MDSNEHFSQSIVNLIIHRSTCKPHDVTILTVVVVVVVVCSESILSVVFQFF